MHKTFKYPKLKLMFLLDESKNSSYTIDFSNAPRPLGTFAFVAAGCAEYITEGQRFSAEQGDVIFIPPGGTYVSHWSPGPIMYAHQFEMGQPRDRRYVVQKLNSHFGDADDFLRALEAENDFFALECFYRICSRHFHELKSVETRIDERIRPALERIESEPQIAFEVGELARICHLSESYFYPIFKKSVGMTPIEYRRRMLVMKAQRLLDERELSIGEVASQLGFESETYFRRVFKGELGISPREYRNRDYSI